MNSLKETMIKTFMRVLENQKLPDIPREQKICGNLGLMRF